MKGKIIFEKYNGKIIEISELKFKFLKTINDLYEKVSEPIYLVEGICIGENIKKVTFKNCTLFSQYSFRFSCLNNETIIELINCVFNINALKFSYNAVKIEKGKLDRHLDIHVIESPFLEISNFGIDESPRFNLYVRNCDKVNLENIDSLNIVKMDHIKEIGISESSISTLNHLEIKTNKLNMNHVYLKGHSLELFYEEKNIQNTILEAHKRGIIRLPFVSYLKTSEQLIINYEIFNSELQQARINFLSQLKALRDSVNSMVINNNKIIESGINRDMGIEILRIRRSAKQNIAASNESQQKRKVKTFKIKNDTNV